MIVAKHYRVDTTLIKMYGILTQVTFYHLIGSNVNSSKFHTFIFPLVKVKGTHPLGVRYGRAVIHSLLGNNCCFYWPSYLFLGHQVHPIQFQSLKDKARSSGEVPEHKERMVFPRNFVNVSPELGPSESIFKRDAFKIFYKFCHFFFKTKLNFVSSILVPLRNEFIE